MPWIKKGWTCELEEFITKYDGIEQPEGGWYKWSVIWHGNSFISALMAMRHARKTSDSKAFRLTWRP